MPPITIQTSVKASPAQAWTCFTSPEHIVNWNFAGDDWHCPSAVNDLRVGGRFSWRMEAKDGSFGFDFEGVYEEIIPNALIRYVMDDGRGVQVTFKETSTGTLVTETFDPESENPIEMQRDGWGMILENYRKLVDDTFIR